MDSLPTPLHPLANYAQFILYAAVKSDTRPGKTDKFPCNSLGERIGINRREYWLTHEQAIAAAKTLGLGVAFVFTKDDPFFFVDLDDCLTEQAAWSPVAQDVMQRLSGAAIEISNSGRGLHIFGTGKCPDHACRNSELSLEFYTENRFVALTGTNAVGDAAHDCSVSLPSFVSTYFPPRSATQPQEWTHGPVAEWDGIEDDDTLIMRACEARSVASVFGARASFLQLWSNDIDALSKQYEDQNRAYDSSMADAALAQHLAFWTGNDCERIQRLMLRSGLVRDKWDREDYLPRTILRAVSLQEKVYGARAKFDGPKLKGTDAQIKWAESIRAQKLHENTGALEAFKLGHGLGVSAKFWIDNQHKTTEELVELIQTPRVAEISSENISEPKVMEGYQFLGADQQLEHFRGCVYIQELHRVFTPTGAKFKPEQFNAIYGGYVFQLEYDSGGKTTRKAWEAFTESQLIRYPQALSECFRPELPSGEIVEEEGVRLVNTYVPLQIKMTPGDVTPFTRHLSKLLPDHNDQQILLAYMAACVQHKGVKFQWAPLLQGVEGNGKTLFTSCVAAAIGHKYTHMPPANEISEKYNSWLFGTLFIGVEDIYVPEQKREIIEVLKPMITSRRMARRAMQTDQVMGDVRCNFIFNSNHRNALPKTKNGRRIAVFFTAQQEHEDLSRDGLDGDYFPEIYRWLEDGGYAKVAYFLQNYQIPDALNPAGACHRAPQTSSTEEAVAASLGGVEQEILEAIDEGRSGFSGGWISSMALDRLLQNIRAVSKIPHNKRKELLYTLGYEWHPALRQGRVNSVVSIDGGKPRLFIRRGHIHGNLSSPAEVVKAYVSAQSASPELMTSQSQRAGP